MMTNKEYAAFQSELFVARSKRATAQQFRVARNNAMARARAEKARVDAGCAPPLTGGTSAERIELNVSFARELNHEMIRLGGAR